MRWILDLFNKRDVKKKMENRIDKREQALYRIGREQFLALKEKGLKIPIFTL